MSTMKRIVLAGGLVLALAACEEQAASAPTVQGLGPAETEDARRPAPGTSVTEPQAGAMTRFVGQARAEITPENVEAEAAALERELRAELAAEEE
jgi:glucose/arabinose dehydrogenase